jgi:hypothetical protein
MDYVERILRKYPWLSEEDAEEIIAKAKMFYYGIVYKSDISHYDEDDLDTPRKTAWLNACCDEIVERAGCSSATAYRENGLQINFDHSQISLGLISMLTPVVGVIRR